jgi:hypothetical protein
MLSIDVVVSTGTGTSAATSMGPSGSKTTDVSLSLLAAGPDPRIPPVRSAKTGTAHQHMNDRMKPLSLDLPVPLFSRMAHPVRWCILK